MSLARKSLIVDSHVYHFDVIRKNKTTYSIQISDEDSMIADLPLDPLDNTLAAVISEDVISRLGKNAESVLMTLSSFLQEQIGAKEFILVPSGTVLSDFTLAQDASFKRLRHVNRHDLENNSAAILQSYKNLAGGLDEKFEIVSGIKAIEEKLQHDKPYEEIFALLMSHADFTPEKMTEYKEEEIAGVRSRFNHGNVQTLALVNNQNRLCGMIRVLSMGDNFGYLSDETIHQEIVSWENFEGGSQEEKIKNRAKFLLAYLANKACALVQDQDHFLLIAASGREDIYDAIDLQTFPISSCNYVVMMKLMPPAELLNSIKGELLKPSHSNAAVISNMGILPSPAQTIAVNQQQGDELIQQRLDKK